MNLISKFSMMAVVVALASSCSKTPYATFGGGPKKLTAGESRNIYANLPSEYTLREKAVLLSQETNTPKQEAAVAGILKAVYKIEKIQASASSNRLSLADKITLAREANQLKKEIAKVEKEAVTEKTQEGGKSQLVAVLLAFFLGGIGIHRFYLGYTWQGVVQLLTGGGCGVWALIDFIRILIGDLKPKDGDYEKTL